MKVKLSLNRLAVGLLISEALNPVNLFPYFSINPVDLFPYFSECKCNNRNSLEF